METRRAKFRHDSEEGRSGDIPVSEMSMIKMRVKE